MENWQKIVLCLREITREKKISIKEISEKTGKHQTTISSFFAVRNPPTLAHVLEIAEIIGVEINIIGMNEGFSEKAIENYKKNKRTRTVNNILK